jgi:hypothetical protein
VSCEFAENRATSHSEEKFQWGATCYRAAYCLDFLSLSARLAGLIPRFKLKMGRSNFTPWNASNITFLLGFSSLSTLLFLADIFCKDLAGGS